MNITVLSIFPEIINSYFQASIMAKAVERGLVTFSVVDFRDYAEDKHHTCDDYAYGGGPGMVLKADPLANAMDTLGLGNKHVVYPSPSGILFTEEDALRLSEIDELIFICGRYEGVDQRIIDRYVDEELSIGDYVLSSGELASLVIIDAVYRHIQGVIREESLEEESFTDGLLEYPHYTRPAVFKEDEVPRELLSGNHEEIRKWRLKKRLEKTYRNRRDLLSRISLSEEAEDMLKEIEEEEGSHGSHTTG